MKKKLLWIGVPVVVAGVVIGGRYTLEVSSPGLERKLSGPRDFERFQGRKAKITLREPVENRRHWEGTLAGFSGGIITLEPAPGQSVCFESAVNNTYLILVRIQCRTNRH